MKSSVIIGSLSGVLFAFCLSMSLLGQSESGSAAMEGTVKDPAGAVVQGATVVLKNGGTGLERTVKTDSNGNFSARVLPIGTYTVIAKAEGFAQVPVTVVLTVGKTTPVWITLALPGARAPATEMADSDTSSIDSETAGTTISEQLVSDLPIRGRNFTEFAQLTPAIVQESDRSGLVISGQRSINSNVAIDGADFNDALQGDRRGGNDPVFFFPQTAVREFQVVRSGATAEVGRTGAGLVNVVTKSGTNDFHGEAFYFNRNRYLTSPDAFGQRLNNLQNQFGGSIGGPVVRDRAHFFFGIEKNSLRVPFVVQFQTIPGVTVPSNIASLEGEQHGSNNPGALFGRADLIVNNQHTVNVQYTNTRFRGENFNYDTAQQDISVDGNYTRENSSNGIKGALISVLSLEAINEVRVQVATDDRLEQPNSTSGQAVIANFGTLGGDTTRPRLFDTTRYQVADYLSFDTGSHRIRLGLDLNVNSVRQEQESNIQPRYDYESRTVGSTTIASLDNYVAGRPRRFRQTVPAANPADLIYTGTQTEIALFAQDKVRLFSQLVADFGLRYEAQFNPQPKNPNPLFPQTARIPNDLHQWQPRLGLAYAPGSRDTTVIRISAGLLASRTPANLFQRVTTNNGLTSQEIEIAETTACRNSTVVNLANCNLRGPNAVVRYPNGLTTIPAAFIVRPRVFGFASDFKNPRTFQTSATLEQRIGRGFVLTTGYIHSSSYNLQRRVDRNLFPPTLQASGFPIFSATRPNSTIAQLEINESSAHSRYDALTLSVRGHFLESVQFDGNYTFASNRDDDSNERAFSRETTLNPFNLKAEEGPSKQDVRHNLNLSGLLDLGDGFTLSSIVVTRSGFPYTAVIEDGTDTNNDLNDGNERAVVGGVVSKRFAFRQPFAFNLDLRLLKEFSLGEGKRMTLSVEAYNVTRNTNRGYGPDSLNNFCTSTASLADSTNPLQISCPVGFFPNVRANQPTTAPSTARFGGARQLQLGARFTF